MYCKSCGTQLPENARFCPNCGTDSFAANGQKMGYQRSYPVTSLINMITGVIYARVSSIGDRQSTERQVKDLSEYAKYKGIEVCKVFEEHISGAKKNDGRTVLCEAMEYCKANA